MHSLSLSPTTSPDGKTKYNYKNVSGYGGIAHGYALTSSTTRNDDGSERVVHYPYDFVEGVYACTAKRRQIMIPTATKLADEKQFTIN